MKKTTLLMTLVLSLALGLGLAPRNMAAETLTVFIWSEYMDPEVIAGFEKESGAKVRLDYYESNEEMVAKLQSGGLGHYDIIVPSTYILPSLINLGLIQPLDQTQLPNIKNLSPAFVDSEIDPGNKYTVPYQWGTSGLAVRHEHPENLDPSWKILFDPKSELGGFIIFDTARDAIGSALKYLGYSLNSTDPKEIEEAVKLLSQTKKRPTFLGFDNGVGGLSKVMGEIAVCAQVYNGEAMKATLEDADVHYLLPKEGGEIWTDLVAIPQKAPQSELAHKFINYLMEPQVAAKLASFNQYATPNEAAKAFVPKEELDNKAMYPEAEVMKNWEYMKDLGSANRIYDEAWTMLKTQ